MVEEAVPLSGVGLPGPPDFPSSAYEAVRQHLKSTPAASAAAWPHFNGGWNGMAFRFLCCAEHDDSFTGSVQRSGTAPAMPERYIQERELFAFFVTGLSAVESFHFAAHAIAACVQPLAFPMSTDEELRQLTIGTIATRFAAVFPGDPLTVAMTTLRADKELSDWQSIRNILAHRLAPGRTHYARVGGSPAGLESTTWLKGIPIDLATTASRRSWLAGVITDMVQAADGFVRRHVR